MVEHPATPEPTERSGPWHKAHKVSSRATTWLAWFLWAFSVTLVALTGLLRYRTLEVPREQWPMIPAFEQWPLIPTLILEVLFLAYPTVGALIASYRPANPIGWIFFAAGFLWIVPECAHAYANYAMIARPNSLPGTPYMAWLADSGIGIPGMLLVLTLLFSWFPDGRPLSRNWRFVPWAAVTGGTMFFLSWATGPKRLYSYPSIDNPFGIEGGLREVVQVSGRAGLLILLISWVIAAISLLLRIEEASQVERQQIKWLAYSLLLIVISVVYPWYLTPPALTLLPIAVGIAILKYRLYDIDIIINRTLLYGALSACVVGLYVLVVGGASALFQVRGSFVVSLLAVGLVAVIFQPLRNRLQRAVNRLVYGERDDPYAVLSRLGQRLEATLAPEEALSTIVETVAQALKLPYAAITLRQDGRFVTVAEHGTPASEPVILPLVHQGEEVGQLIVGSRMAGEAFTTSDRKLLDDLARQAGAAAYAARLTADLQRSRERLVSALEEERRRLRRDLHDGLGPTLGGLTLGLDAARSMVARQPAVEELLARLKDESQEAVSDIRRLVYGLRPPALDDLGLVAAIRQHAAKYGSLADSVPTRPGGKDVLVFTVEAPEDLPPLPAAVEVACYRIAQEAVNNAARHAEARSCRVELSINESAEALELQVTDDGAGIPAGRRAGVGMSSMRERAEELGGTLEVEPASEGGTRVLARLPLPEKDE
jgi:two-component system NarL family sensor kinase